jgi:MoxR-like ATPase
LEVIKTTTSGKQTELQKIMHSADILQFQELVRKVPVPDNVMEYAVKLVSKTRPSSEFTTQMVKDYISYGAGPRAGQFLILGAKCRALSKGKFSPDIEDVKAIAIPVLRHRIIKNYKAEAENMQVETIINSLL